MKYLIKRSDGKYYWYPECAKDVDLPFSDRYCYSELASKKFNSEAEARRVAESEGLCNYQILQWEPNL